MIHRGLLTLFLTLALAAPGFAAQPLGGLDVYGAVWTNQTALPSGSNLYAGDQLRTDSDALAILASPEVGRVELRADSNARFESDALTLDNGTAASSRMAVRVGEFEVTPKDADADNWFVVSERDGERVVSAYRGDLLIASAGAAPVLVPAGSFAMAAAPPKQPADDSDAKSDSSSKSKTTRDQARRRTGRNANTGNDGNGGWSIGPLGKTGTVAVVSGAVVATTTGLAFGLNDEGASPE